MFSKFISFSLEIEDPWGKVPCLDGESAVVGILGHGLIGQLNANQLFGIDLDGRLCRAHKSRVVNTDMELQSIEERILEINSRRLRSADLERSLRLRSSTIARKQALIFSSFVGDDIEDCFGVLHGRRLETDGNGLFVAFESLGRECLHFAGVQLEVTLSTLSLRVEILRGAKLLHTAYVGGWFFQVVHKLEALYDLIAQSGLETELLLCRLGQTL